VFWAFINVSLHTLWWRTCNIHFGWRKFSDFRGSVFADFQWFFYNFFNSKCQYKSNNGCFLSLVFPWILVEKIILTLTYFFISFFLQIFQGKFWNPRWLPRSHDHPFQKKIQRGFFHLATLYQLFMPCKWKKYDKTSSEFFTAWVSDLVKCPEKGLCTMAAIWPSTGRVKCNQNYQGQNDVMLTFGTITSRSRVVWTTDLLELAQFTLYFYESHVLLVSSTQGRGEIPGNPLPK
jgi:hypothetical protein